MVNNVYLPKLRDRVVVLDQPIRNALGKFDAKFGYAESFDATSNKYSGLIYAKTAPVIFGPSALVVRAEVALEHLRRETKGSQADRSQDDDGGKQGPRHLMRQLSPTASKVRSRSTWFRPVQVI